MAPSLDIKTIELITSLRRMDVLSAHEHLTGLLVQVCEVETLSLEQENLRLRKALAAVLRDSTEPILREIARKALENSPTS